MDKFTRREWLQFGAKLCALMGIETTSIPRIVQALESIQTGNTPVVWLQGQSCSGCSVSFINSDAPDPVEILTQYISLRFHSTLSTATGALGMEMIENVIENEKFYLVVEGSVPAKMPKACLMGHKPITTWIEMAANKVTALIAIGSCAAFGGIPAAENNPTGAISVPDFIKERRINIPVIRLPGCPCHPDWFVGTLAYTLAYGLPELDSYQRPTMFYKRLIHDQCPRFADYERERFAQTFGDEGCLFKLGCAGPITHADCTLRHWNSGVNTCIRAGAPCVGCASETFARKSRFPLYTKS